MQPLDRNGYTEEQVKAMLHGRNGSRVISFRYDLLDKNENKKGELLKVTSGEVEFNSFATIKRTAKFTLEEEQQVTTVVDREATWNDYAELTWNDLDAK
ncbi:hypothetical protein HV436_01385 [Bacillus sporothermodurans]|jgi:hypothetical protein|uniref:hypothetical protein n=1 Tax=Heyndrickxia sporothermodurans TaxID=46224 RepID=UPI00192B9B1A|nr:hypothetical protein [Heyndrickxia sporothermodurans]MBL5776989.1 hypothetical protein [Heyndrickxia sporothermodurans]MBL5798516.1 hypothetical protein [Heyndrickxia sporothermodurans]MBL5809433.1 hypothetical protein [Heyndrickxia sporothermodurans]MBL5813068.1 hypothetical protein [Heyndrickxia sporothermodurans]MBL5816492.1 hypothetical protein [Heyndrickxia sporothermodurans]